MVEVVTVSIGALGSATKECDGWIEKLGITNNVGVMQKTMVGNCENIEKSVGDIKKRSFY